MDYSLGRVTNVSGAQMTVEADEPLSGSVRIGAMVKTKSGEQQVIGTIAAIEAGKYSPSLEAAFRIAQVFNLPLEEVFHWEAKATP